MTDANPLANPAVFRRLVVDPNVVELAEDFSSVRLALNAVLSVDALAAHIYWWARENAPQQMPKFKGDDSGYRADLASKSQSFQLLRDCAKALKHVRLTKFDPRVAAANKMQSMPVGFGEGPYGRGRYGGPPQVIVQIDDGSFDYVESIIQDCLSILEQEMQQTGCGNDLGIH